MNTIIAYPFMNGVCLSCSNCDTSERNGTKMDVRKKLMELLDIIIQPGQKTLEDIADYLIRNGVTVQENVEISDELLKQLKNAPITTWKEEPLIEMVQEWVSVKDRLPKYNGKLQAFLVCRNQPSSTNGKVLIQTEFFTNDFSGNNNVTHWMPLPQPPKGE